MANENILQNFNPFIGKHCETTTTGSLLNQIGIEFSEPMLFGIGEGLGYIFWNMKIMNFPFIGGRIKPDTLTENICRNLHLKLDITETSSTKKAWKNVTKHLDNGKAVGLKLDCYHLEYFKVKIHFAGHYVAMYGYDNDSAYLVDTNGQERSKTSLKSLELARNEKGAMSSKNRTYVISKTNKTYDLKEVIKKAIYTNAVDFLNPPIKNIGYKGILKTSTELKKWFKNSKDIKTDFQTTAMIMENGGTGGSLFRNLYRDFLKESAEILDSKEIKQVAEEYAEIAILWKKVSDLLYKVGETEDIKYIKEASDILIDLSERERVAMEKLKHIYKQ